MEVLAKLLTFETEHVLLYFPLVFLEWSSRYLNQLDSTKSKLPKYSTKEEAAQITLPKIKF